MRAKLLEDGTKPVLTGDAKFDNAFLLLGSEAPPIVGALRPAHRDALLDSSHLRPDVLGQEVTLGSPPVSHRVHLRCEPDLRSDRSTFHFVAMGEENFRPEFLAGSVLDAVALVVKLETAP